MKTFSLDDLILNNQKSLFLIRLKGKKNRLHLRPGDFLVIDKNLPLQAQKLALMVIKNKFCIGIVSREFLEQHDPEAGDFIWGMVKTVVRELK